MKTFNISSFQFVLISITKKCYYFSQSVEATVNLRYVTQGILKRSKTSFNPQLGQIKFSLKVADPAWEPRQGLNQWDPGSRTFTEVSSIRNVEKVIHSENY